jgi:enoyl-CoA hydratase
MAELITRREGAIGWIVFSNVARHNAVTLDMWRALPAAFDAYERDPAVRLVVLAGDGDKAFISGADISQFETQLGAADAQAAYNAAVELAYTSPPHCSKPVIAKIRGICMGGGLGLAAACDLRIAAEDAVFRMPAARIGLGYNFVGLKRFVDVMGPGHTADIFFSARKFDAADALAMGLVNRVVPVAGLDRAVAEYARLIAENAPLTLAAVKSTIRQIMSDPDKRDLAAVERMVEDCFASADYKEGFTAFMEKREPRFKGR